MNDFSNELYPGTPGETDEERIQRLMREADSLEKEANTLSSQPTQQPTPQPEATAPAVSEPTQQKQKEDFYGADLSFQQDDVDPSALQTFAEAALAVPTAGTDFVVDLLNLAPGVDLPKVPEFENDVIQTVREISSIVLPTVGLGGFGAARLAGAAGKLAKGSKASKFLTDPLVKWIGNTSFQAGTGAFVDYTVEINQEDDNLAGVLKANWPQQMGWIPENVATLDSDDPDAKRAKNVLEGVYLGAGTDVLIGVAKLLKRTRGFKTEIIPQSEKSGKYFEKNMPADATVEDAVERSAGKRELVTDQIGKYNFDKSVELNGVERALDEPLYGVTDMYGYQEYAGRSVDDGGIALASVDSYRVRNNVASTNGRVGSIVSEGFIKRFNDGNFDSNVMLRGVKQDMLDADKFDVRLADGTYITAKQIIENGEELAAEHYMMSLPDLKKLFNELATEESGEMGVRTLSSTGMEAARQMMKKYMDDFINMDIGRAEAYLETSIAGQLSDTAQGMRLVEGTPAIERAQEQILDRMQMLMAMRGRAAYVRGRALNMTNMWNRLTSSGSDANKAAYAKRVAKQIKEEGNETLRTLKAIELDAGLTVDTLRELSQNNKEMLSPLWLAYEFTDGNVDTVAKLNKFLKESTGTIRKAIIDREPGMPSIILQGMWANIYNSTLSAFATPIKAGISNFAGLVQKPLGNYVGAMRTGDTRLIKRGMYQYFSSLESLQNSFQYMAQVFKRSATEADVNNLVRDDLFVKNERQIEILQAFADAKSLQGEEGPQLMMQQVKAMNDLAMHPWLRFGNRAMQALDGFTQSMIAHAEAKGRAFDEVTNFGRREFDTDKAEQVYKKAYSEMFNDEGLITDKAVQYTAGEIALNLDNEANNALSNIIARAPALKPFFLFTKTPLNEIKLMASYTPMGRFIKGLNDFDLPVEKLSDEEIVEKLQTRGIQLDTADPQAYVNKYNEIRADFRGRRALGELAVIGAVGLMVSDRLTGNGIYDKQKQRARRDQDWKPRSIRLPGGNWVSYDNLGPFTNWMALTADIMDNYDTLSPNDAGELMRKMGFVVSASFTDKTYLAGLEPLLSILRGDPSELSRWSSSFLSSATIRGSSQMAELARLFDPGLKEVEQDMFNLIQNRLPGLKGTLPAQYDYIDGGEVGIPNFLTRVTNNYLPWKVNGKISPEKQFLIDIEYDGRPNLKSNGRGVEFTPQERSDIARIMGEDKLFKKAIQDVMNSQEAKRFRKAYKEASAMGIDVNLREFESLHMALDDALTDAVKFAGARIPGSDRVTEKLLANEIISDFLQGGQKSQAKEYIKYIRQKGFTY